MLRLSRENRAEGVGTWRGQCLTKERAVGDGRWSKRWCEWPEWDKGYEIEDEVFVGGLYKPLIRLELLHI